MNNCLHRLSGLAAFILMSLCTTTQAEERIVLHFTDGSTTSFLVAEKPKVSFGESSIHVTAQNIEADYDLISVHKFTFDSTISLGSNQIDDNETRFELTGRSGVRAIGLKPYEKAHVHTLNGILVSSFSADDNGIAEMDLSSLSAGVYVISTESGNSFKIKL